MQCTAIGHSGGGGWASAIVKRLEIGNKAVAFESGATALLTSDDSNQPNCLSVEVVDRNGRGSRWGLSAPNTLKCQVMRVVAPTGHQHGRTFLHMPHKGIIEALEEGATDATDP
jgi:hypothetical protein